MTSVDQLLKLYQELYNDDWFRTHTEEEHIELFAALKTNQLLVGLKGLDNNDHTAEPKQSEQ